MRTKKSKRLIEAYSSKFIQKASRRNDDYLKICIELLCERWKYTTLLAKNYTVIDYVSG